MGIANGGERPSLLDAVYPEDRLLLAESLQRTGREGADTEVVHRVRKGVGAYGYNVASMEYEDLLAAGIADPTKVVRVALQNAASVAALMLTTEALIAEVAPRR